MKADSVDKALRLVSTQDASSEASPADRKALYLCEVLIAADESRNFLSNLTAEHYRRVREVGQDLNFAPGDMVFRQGEIHDGIFLIERGNVRTFYVGPTGREITLAYWTPGHFVGGPEIFGGGEHIWSGEAMEASRLLKLKGADLRHLMEDIPALAVGLVEGLVAKGKCYSALLQMLGTRSVVERLAQLLLNLAGLDGVPDGARVTIDRPITHEILANMVGATRQWVTMTLDRFQKQGLIELRRYRIVILDMDLLQRTAGLE